MPIPVGADIDRTGWNLKNCYGKRMSYILYPAVQGSGPCMNYMMYYKEQVLKLFVMSPQRQSELFDRSSHIDYIIENL